VFASHFPSDEVQDEAEVRRSTPISADDLSKNTAAVAVLIEFALYWASLVFLRAMQLEVELLCANVLLFVDSFLSVSASVYHLPCLNSALMKGERASHCSVAPPALSHWDGLCNLLRSAIDKTRRRSNL